MYSFHMIIVSIQFSKDSTRENQKLSYQLLLLASVTYNKSLPFVDWLLRRNLPVASSWIEKLMVITDEYQELRTTSPGTLHWGTCSRKYCICESVTIKICWIITFIYDTTSCRRNIKRNYIHYCSNSFIGVIDLSWFNIYIHK